MLTALYAATGLTLFAVLWLGLGLFLALTPLGIVAVGRAWGEWHANEFSDPAVRRQIAAAERLAQRELGRPDRGGDLLEQGRTVGREPEQEVRVGFELLKSLGLRTRGVRVVSCPSCARQGFDVIRTVQALEDRLSHIKTPLSLSVLGCVVNGPGEARETDIGITGGGQGKHMVYLSGVTDHHVQDADMIDHIVKLVEAKAAEIEAASDAVAHAAE